MLLEEKEEEKEKEGQEEQERPQLLLVMSFLRRWWMQPVHPRPSIARQGKGAARRRPSTTREAESTEARNHRRRSPPKGEGEGSHRQEATEGALREEANGEGAHKSA